MTVAAVPSELAFEPPDTIRRGRAVVRRAGGVTYRLLGHLDAQPTRAATVRDLCVAVWGESAGPAVGRVTVKSAIHRANEVLGVLGATEKVTLDGEAVLLL